MKIMKKINEIKMEKDKTIMLQASSAKRSVGHSPPGNVQPFTASVYTDALLATTIPNALRCENRGHRGIIFSKKILLFISDTNSVNNPKFIYTRN